MLKDRLEGRMLRNFLFIPGLCIGQFLLHGIVPHLNKLKIREVSAILKITTIGKIDGI